MQFYVKSLRFLTLILTFFLYIQSLLAQKSPEKYLSLKGQACFDSLEVLSASNWENYDTIGVYKNLRIIREHAKKTNNKELAIFSDYLQALYLDRGVQLNHDLAMELYQKVLQTIPRLNLTNYPRFETDVLHRIGFHLYKYDNKNEAAADYLLKADITYRKIGYENIPFATSRLGALGAYYFVSSENETAEKCLKEALQYIDKEPSMWECNNVLTKLGMLSKRAKKYEESCEYLRRVSKYIRHRKDSTWIGVAAGMMAYNMIKLNNFEAAEPLALQDLESAMHFNSNDTSSLISVYGTLCIIEGGKKNKEKVAFYFQKAKSLLDAYKSAGLVPKMNLYWNRMAADTLLGDYEAAFRHLYISSEEKKLFDKKKLDDKVKEASVKYDSERNKLSAELANEQVQNARFVLILLSLLLIFALIGGYFLYYLQRNKKNQFAQKLILEQKEAERLAVIDELKTRFFSNVTHEFRTPLTLILEPARQLVQQLNGTSHQQNALIIENNSKRLLHLVNQLLDLSKLESGSMQIEVYTGNILAFIQPICHSFLSLALQKNQLLTWQHPAEIPIFSFDKDKIAKIVNNLLANACKFSPNGTKILLRTTITDNHLQILVADEGIGMSEETLSHLFERFYQADNSATRKNEGTGIGLALVKELVELMGGKIEVKSELDKGSTFIVLLPIQEKIQTQSLIVTHNAENPLLPLAEKEIVTEKETYDATNQILLVEDNDDMLMFVKSILQESNFQVITAKNGKEGIEKARSFTPDLIISDVMMPETDGYELTEILKNDLQTSHIPIVLLTAKNALDSKLKGLKIGADEYIGKPFNSEELLLRVQKLIQLRGLIQAQYSLSMPVTILEERKNVEKQSIETEIVQLSELDQKFMSNLQEYLSHNLDNEDLTIADFSEILFLSRSQLHRKVIALTGQSPMEYVRHYRLEKAKEMLQTHQYRVNEVASMVGFPNPKHFATTFKKHFGISPSDI